jgi:hypothetical protein
MDTLAMVSWMSSSRYSEFEVMNKDSFRESKRVQPVHSEIALASYCSESEYIKKKQETIVYDYQVLTLMYILFLDNSCYGRINCQSFTIGEEEDLPERLW